MQIVRRCQGLCKLKTIHDQSSSNKVMIIVDGNLINLFRVWNSQEVMKCLIKAWKHIEKTKKTIDNTASLTRSLHHYC